ncbi:MAG: sodium:proton antiporter [Thermomicrobiales bacterium]
MIIIFALGVAALFGAGCYLLLKRDLIRLIVGVVLIGNAANLFIMSSALQRGPAAVLPVSGSFADPIVQSMTLTAIVISFAVSALMLALTYRVYGAHASVDIEQLVLAEEEDLERDEAESSAEDEVVQSGQPVRERILPHEREPRLNLAAMPGMTERLDR